MSCPATFATCSSRPHGAPLSSQILSSPFADSLNRSVDSFELLGRNCAPICLGATVLSPRGSFYPSLARPHVLTSASQPAGASPAPTPAPLPARLPPLYPARQGSLSLRASARRLSRAARATSTSILQVRDPRSFPRPALIPTIPQQTLASSVPTHLPLPAPARLLSPAPTGESSSTRPASFPSLALLSLQLTSSPPVRRLMLNTRSSKD